MQFKDPNEYSLIEIIKIYREEYKVIKSLSLKDFDIAGSEDLEATTSPFTMFKNVDDNYRNYLNVLRLLDSIDKLASVDSCHQELFTNVFLDQWKKFSSSTRMYKKNDYQILVNCLGIVEDYMRVFKCSELTDYCFIDSLFSSLTELHVEGCTNCNGSK